MSVKKGMNDVMYKEFVSCLRNGDTEKYKDLREIFRKSSPSFSDKGKVDSRILEMFIKSIEEEPSHTSINT